MKKGAAIAFIVLYGLVLIRPAAPYLAFSLHHADIIEKLCENRDRPELQCNGACYLQKMVKQATEEERAPVPVMQPVEENPPAVVPVREFAPEAPAGPAWQAAATISRAPQDHLIRIFRPPRA